MKSFLPIYFLAFFAAFHASSQNYTLGTIQNDPETSEGYWLLHPLNFDTTYLMNNCGQILHHWSSQEINGMFANLREDGNLVRCQKSPDPNYFQGGGETGLIEIVDWNDQIIWSKRISDSEYRLHHDIELMPNGNILAIAWERKSSFDCTSSGRNPNNIPDGELWPTVIFEIEPIGTDSANIVWEWHAWDHLIQDFDAGQANFGNVSQAPRKIDINKGNPLGADDWAHVNGIDYNPTLDQIALSTPMFNEIWIIDHSTTTVEAASSTGGNSGHGGDLLWRWGNPSSYNQGTWQDQELFFQHDCRWVEHGIYKDMISIYNNRDSLNGDYASSVIIIDPQFDTVSNQYAMNGNVFSSGSPDYKYFLPDTLFSPRISGAQIQPNGHITICSGNNSHLLEIDENDNIIWQYRMPIGANGGFGIQGGSLANPKGMFNINKYSTDYPGFSGQILVPGRHIETGGSFCTDISSISELIDNTFIYPNPIDKELTISLEGDHHIIVQSIDGKEVLTRSFDSQITLNFEGLTPGSYLIRIDNSYTKKIVKL